MKCIFIRYFILISLLGLKFHSVKGIDNPDSIINNLNREAYQFFMAGRYDESVNNLMKVAELQLKYTPERIVGIVNTYLNISSSLRNTWNFDEALEHGFHAYELITKHDSANVLYYRSINLIATIYQEMGDYEKALQYIMSSNRIFNKLNIKKDYYIITGEAFNQAKLNNFENSNNLWFEALKENKDKYIIYNNLALNYIEMNNISEAARYYNLIFSLPDLQESEMSRVYLNYGIFLDEQKGLRDSTLYYYKLALDNILTFHPQNKSRIALMYQNYGEFYIKEKDIPKSLDFYQKALTKLCLNFSDTLVLKSPGPESAEDQNRLYRILKLKARALYEYHIQFNDIRYLKASLEVSNTCFKLINKMRYRITSEGSQFSISENERDTYTEAITTAYLLYEITEEEQYLNEAFHINESGKAFMLLAHLRKQKAMEFGRIPSDLLEKETELNRKLSFYEEQILAERIRKQADMEKIRTWEDMLAGFNLEYDILLRELEKKYPEYYNLKYQSEHISPSEIKRKLRKSDAVIEYALIDSLLYTFVITKDHSLFQRHIVGNELEKECNDFYRLITKQDFSRDVNATYQNYIRRGYRLYSLLLEPFEQVIKDKNLIIVADGEISYLPFDALLTEMPDTTEFNYRTLPYLIRKHSAGFSYSSTMHFNHGIRRKASNRSVLAFAPTYSNVQSRDIDRQDARYNLIMLPGIRDEVRKIAKKVNTDVFLDFDATESNFKNRAADYKILHLAMHTILNDENPLYSRMAFTQMTDTTEDGFLHAYEVYNMQLKAKMVVLSSCSSGFGKLQEGEGMQSLARSFAYAGCPSILMTLWEVADFSTVKIMTDFYNELSQGYQKHEALRLSKLNFIERADHLKSNPFFWSSFIILGDSGPVYNRYKFLYMLWFIPFIALPAIVIYKRKKMIRRNFGWAYS